MCFFTLLRRQTSILFAQNNIKQSQFIVTFSRSLIYVTHPPFAYGSPLFPEFRGKAKERIRLIIFYSEKKIRGCGEIGMWSVYTLPNEENTGLFTNLFLQTKILQATLINSCDINFKQNSLSFIIFQRII